MARPERRFRRALAEERAEVAVKASNRPRQRKSRKAVTGDVLASLLETSTTERLMDMRDRPALDCVCLRRPSPLGSGGIGVEDMVDEEPVRAPAQPARTPLPCLTIHLGRTKTTISDDNEHVLLIGLPVSALKHWLAELRSRMGRYFGASISGAMSIVGR